MAALSVSKPQSIILLIILIVIFILSIVLLAVSNSAGGTQSRKDAHILSQCAGAFGIVLAIVGVLWLIIDQLFALSWMKIVLIVGDILAAIFAIVASILSFIGGNIAAGKRKE